MTAVAAPARKSDTLARLRKVEGQVRGLARMVESDAYCVDIVTQVASVTGALHAVALQLLDQHLRRCLVEAVATGEHEAKLAEAGRALERLMRL